MSPGPAIERSHGGVGFTLAPVGKQRQLKIVRDEYKPLCPTCFKLVETAGRAKERARSPEEEE